VSQDFFFELTPDRVMDAVETGGVRCTGRCQALNSFENRVYDVEIESESPDRFERHRVAKFYRPGRWSEAQIREEHQFLKDLRAAEIPVVAPVELADGDTLHEIAGVGIWYALFPKVGGRAPDELSPEELRRVGRLLARIHAIGVSREASHRLRLTPTVYGRENLAFLVSGQWIPLEYEARYRKAVERVCAIAEPWFAEFPMHRIHGDCHLGNLLSNQDGFFFVDFDDMLIGPAVQDLWLLLPRGSGEERRLALENLLEGYEEMRAFDRRSLRLIEALRALRFVHYTAWIARRWKDPAFPLAFPQFGSHRYWNDETEDLERQVTLLETCNSSSPF